MIAFRPLLNRVVTAFLLSFLASAAAAQNSARLDELYELLKSPDLPNWQIVEDEIWTEWSKSGSPSADLLLKRGQDAMDANDLEAAIEHFTALIDHAPDFAEGYNARATAYFHAGLFGPSLADIKSTLALNPKHFGALAGLAAIMEATGRPQMALKAYRAAAAIHPHEPDLKDALKRMEILEGGETL